MDRETTFGQRIKSLRENSNISLRQFAKLVGLSAGYVSQLENNITLAGMPSEDNIRKMANVLNVTPNELIVLADKLPSDMLEGLKKGLRNGNIKPHEVYSLCRKVDENKT